MISAELRQKFITVFGCISLGIGVTMLSKGDSLPPVVLSILLGTAIGETVRLESSVVGLAQPPLVSMLPALLVMPFSAVMKALL